MPFGLCNAPTAFMRLMIDVLRPFIDQFAFAYLDYILIYNLTWEEHPENLRNVFELIHKHQLHLNNNKYDLR